LPSAGHRLVTARKIAMTGDAAAGRAFHSLVGLAAVLVGWRRLSQPGGVRHLGPAG
jgi:NAD/NADP transhydrogenase beta subunit